MLSFVLVVKYGLRPHNAAVQNKYKKPPQKTRKICHLWFGAQGVKDKKQPRVWQQTLNIISLKETGMRKGGMHIKRGRREGKQMMSSTYKFFICIGWLEWLDCALSCDLTTNPVCKLLFIFRKVCQTWALIFYPDFPLVACSRTWSPHNLWLPLVLMTDY